MPKSQFSSYQVDVIENNVPYKLLPTSRIFCARGHHGDQRQHAEKHKKKDHSSFVPDITSGAQQRNHGKPNDGKHQNKLNKNSETLKKCIKKTKELIEMTLETLLF